MWDQVYNPFHNAALSTIAAAIPVVTLLVLIATGKVKVHFAAIIALVLTNLVTLEKLRSIRGYVLIVVFIVAAILTPPDVLSQFSMAVPMYLLYEGGILFAAILARSSTAVEASEQGPA